MIGNNGHFFSRNVRIKYDKTGAYPKISGPAVCESLLDALYSNLGKAIIRNNAPSEAKICLKRTKNSFRSDIQWVESFVKVFGDNIHCEKYRNFT